MTQLSLFDSSPDLSHHLSRSSDPASSHVAAASKVSSGSASSDRERILEVLRRGGDWTGGEIAAAINRTLPPRTEPWTNVRVIRRTCEMQASGLILKTGERVCRSMGTSQGTYRAR